MLRQICYVLTSDGHDIHADMTLISAQFARRAIRDVSIIVLCDEESGRQVQRRRHALLEHIDRLVPVSSPPGSAAFRNRFVKTQVRRHVEGSILYLDADTLVLKPLDEIFSCNSALAAVSNHNGPANPCEIYVSEKAVFHQMGWPVPGNWYVNGGVLFLNDSTDAYRFCDAWHAKWLAACRVTRTHLDQPSLNSALNEVRPDFSLLEHRFNAQVSISPWAARRASVWHFYHSSLDPCPKTIFATCIEAVRDTGSVPESLIDRISRREHPWCIENPLDFIVIKTILRRKRCLRRNSVHRLWLAREYRALFSSIPPRALRAVARIRQLGIKRVLLSRGSG